MRTSDLSLEVQERRADRRHGGCRHPCGRRAGARACTRQSRPGGCARVARAASTPVCAFLFGIVIVVIVQQMHRTARHSDTNVVFFSFFFWFSCSYFESIRFGTLKEDQYQNKKRQRTSMTRTYTTPTGKRLTYVHSLGSGQFGEAKALQDRRGNMYCLKEVSVKLSDEAACAEVLTQVSVMNETCSHPNIVMFYESWFTHNRMCILMEYAPNGSLDKLIEQYVVANKLHSHACGSFCRGTRRGARLLPQHAPDHASRHQAGQHSRRSTRIPETRRFWSLAQPWTRSPRHDSVRFPALHGPRATQHGGRRTRFRRTSGH